MKIPIDPKLAAETLKQAVPQYDELIAKLQSDSEIFPNIVQFAKKTGLSGYPLLYLDKQIHIKLVLLTLMPVEQINSFNEFVRTLTPDEAIAYLNVLVDEIVVEYNTATIKGSYAALAETMQQIKMGSLNNQVPSFNPDWCARRDSNS